MKHIRRLAAILGIALLAILYLATLFCAIFDTSSGMVMFKASVTCTVLVPILLWGYTVIYRLAKGKDEQELQETLQSLESHKECQQASPSSEPGKEHRGTPPGPEPGKEHRGTPPGPEPGKKS